MAHARHACVARLHELFAAQRLREARGARRAWLLLLCHLSNVSFAQAQDNDAAFWRSYCAEYYEPHAAIALCCCAYVGRESDGLNGMGAPSPRELLGALRHPSRTCSLCASAPFIGFGASQLRSRAQRLRCRSAVLV